MGNKFKNKYRTDTTRLRSWNYAWNGAYFVTICTRKRKHYFGDIKKGKMHLTEIGTIAHKYWQEIPVHFPFVKLGEFVVMPNHVHGIIIIDKQDVNMDMMGDNNNDKNNPNVHSRNQFGPQSQNLASIIRGYKSAVKKYATMHEIDFAWQSRYYDHIIRDEQSFYRISEYIKNNPVNWKKDKFF